MTTIVLPDGAPIPKCGACASDAAYVVIEIHGGAVLALCVGCESPAPGKALAARVAEFAVRVRAREIFSVNP